jgi:hypothetical protein
MAALQARLTPGDASLLAAHTVDPVARYIPLGFRILLYAFLTYFLIGVIPLFYAYDPNDQWPPVIWFIRTFIFLPLHEGGHFISLLFGNTLYVLGGSFWQIMFPFLWFAIALKQRSQTAPFPLFWVGENMMDVSLYIRDAENMALPLLGGHKSGHDWHNLLTQWDMIDSCDSIADIMYFSGLIIAGGAIVFGLVWAFVAFHKSGIPVKPVSIVQVVKEEKLDRMLKEKLTKKEGKKLL